MRLDPLNGSYNTVPIYLAVVHRLTYLGYLSFFCVGYGDFTVLIMFWLKEVLIAPLVGLEAD